MFLRQSFRISNFSNLSSHSWYSQSVTLKLLGWCTCTYFAVILYCHLSSLLFLCGYTGWNTGFMKFYTLMKISKRKIFPRFVYMYLSTDAYVGGTVASWLVHLSPDWAVWVRALAGDTVLCSWARHFALTVCLSTQVNKWLAVNVILGGNPAMD